MDNQDKNRRNINEQGSNERKRDHGDEQIENAKADKKAQKETSPTIEIKSQENVLSGLSDKERAQAAEAENKNVGTYGNDTDSSANGIVNTGLSDKERLDAAEADGRGGGEVINSGLSDKERREAAEEDW